MFDCQFQKIHKNDWKGDSLNGLWVKNDPVLNEIIAQELTKIRKYTTSQVLDKKPLTLSSIRDLYDNPKKLESFNNFAINFVRNINKNKHEDEKLAYRTIQAYNSFLVKLDDFNPKIGFEQIGLSCYQSLMISYPLSISLKKPPEQNILTNLM